MSNSNIIVTKRQSDGTVVQVLPDGTTRPLTEKTDWKRLRAMTPEEVEAAARSDPDNPPLTDANLSA